MKKFFFFILILSVLNKVTGGFEFCKKNKNLLYDEKLFKEKLIEDVKNLREKDLSLLKEQDNLVEYILLFDLYYKFFEKCNDTKKREYKKILDDLELLLKKDNSPEIYYCLSILYGRYAETSNIWDAIKMNIPNRIKKYAEKVIDKKPDIDDYGAYLILGRLYYITPKVPYYTNWQSLDESEIYLKKYLEKNKNSITGKFFLAETYKAKKNFELYDSLINEIVKTTDFDNFQDKKIHDSIIEEIK